LSKKKSNLKTCMLPFLLQMFPVAVTCGNTFVLKPSEKDPGENLLVHTLYIRFGAPLHGTKLCYFQAREILPIFSGHRYVV
jgi:acyl-CoA reductase-like NAD-dependent aldehyde dehydrogenase